MQATVEIELGKTYERWGVRVTPLEPTLRGVKVKLEKVRKPRRRPKIVNPVPSS